jgi:hypothetical protein
VAGYLQVLSAESLEYLEQFCQPILGPKTCWKCSEQKQIAEEMPALWPNLLEILNLENSMFLPDDVFSIIIKLIEIRRNTFLNAATRTEDEYIGWEDTELEHP